MNPLLSLTIIAFAYFAFGFNGMLLAIVLMAVLVWSMYR